MKNKKILSVFALGIIALLGVSLVAAYRGDYSVERPNYSPERHTQMEESFDGLDYSTWVALMTVDGRHPRVVDVVTEDNFATFVKAHDAGKSSDVEKAAELRAQLGLRNGNGLKDGTGFRKGNGERRGSRRDSRNNSGMRNQADCSCLE